MTEQPGNNGVCDYCKEKVGKNTQQYYTEIDANGWSHSFCSLDCLNNYYESIKKEKQRAEQLRKDWPQTNNEQQDELKPCPFCGGKASLILSLKCVTDKTNDRCIDSDCIYWVKCNCCQVSQWRSDTKYDAIACWNSRVDINEYK